MKKDNKRKTQKKSPEVDPLKAYEALDSNKDNPLAKEAELASQDALCDLPIVKLSGLLEGTDGQKRQIVRERLKEKSSGGYFWYHIPYKRIKESLHSGEHEPIARGYSDIRAYKPKPTDGNWDSNKESSLKMLKSFEKAFQKGDVPLKFRQLKKELIIKPKSKSFRHRNLNLSLGKDNYILFRSEVDGNVVLGGALVVCLKGGWTDDQVKLGAYSLQLLLQSIKGDEEEVLPQNVLCVDAMSGKCHTAPINDAELGRVRGLMSAAYSEFTEKWKELTE